MLPDYILLFEFDASDATVSVGNVERVSLVVKTGRTALKQNTDRVIMVAKTGRVSLKGSAE